MKDFILIFGLGGLGGHYDLLAEHLAIIGAKMDGHSAWILRATRISAHALRTDLVRFMHPLDELIIEEIARAT
jgi:hypothetical protein